MILEPFPLWLRGKRVEGENVIAQWEGDSPESVAIIAHYDSQFTSHRPLKITPPGSACYWSWPAPCAKALTRTG